MYISKRNRRGVITLFVLCLVVALTPRILHSFSPDLTVEFSVQEYEEAKEFLSAKKKVKESSSFKSYQKKQKRKFSPPKERFNPNKYSDKDWIELGLSEKQAVVVVKYAKYGIDNNEELKKIFVIPEELYELIKDSTFYPDINKAAKLYQEEYKKKEVYSININNCTKDDLLQLPGIGDYFADKILKYKESLGGYVDNDQLLEVWKFDDEKMNKISSYLLPPSGSINKLNVNRLSAEELKDHPYVTWKIANSIVKMRTIHGDFHSLDELKKSKLINQDWITKMKPYIIFE